MYARNTVAKQYLLELPLVAIELTRAENEAWPV